MFEKYVKDYQRNQEREQDPPDPFLYLSWIEADQNPYRVRILDCRSVTQSLISTTRDKEIAERFMHLRHSTGQEHRGAVPMNSVQVACNLTYPHVESRDGPLFIAETMEDKWDIYLYDNHLYFARSWTGQLAFRARIDFTGTDVVVSTIDVDVSMLETKEMDNIASLAVRQVDFLILSHLYGYNVPHPIPPDFPTDAEKIALYSFSCYGRRALFATYEDFQFRSLASNEPM